MKKRIPIKKIWIGIWAGLVLAVPLAGTEPLVVGFEDVALGGSGVEAYAGPGGGVYYSGSDLGGGFESGGLYFRNAFTDYGGGFFAWSGWAYSTTADVTTAGTANQFSAYPGEAREGVVYGMAYAPSVVDLPVGWKAPASISVSNGTYAGISMRDGDFFGKQFGAGDYFKLTLTGLDAAGNALGSVEVYLADFREGTEPGFILDTWKDLDLSSLGSGVAQIEFTLESTDVGAWGMNTPSFVAVDNIVLNASPTWGGYDVGADGWVDTGDYLGWVKPYGDYVYILALEKFAYVPEAGTLSSAGSWIYLP